MYYAQHETDTRRQHDMGGISDDVRRHVRTLRGRRSATCTTCAKAILPGESYTLVTVIKHGQPRNFAHHEACYPVPKPPHVVRDWVCRHVLWLVRTHFACPVCRAAVHTPHDPEMTPIQNCPSCLTALTFAPKEWEVGGGK